METALSFLQSAIDGRRFLTSMSTQGACTSTEGMGTPSEGSHIPPENVCTPTERRDNRFEEVCPSDALTPGLRRLRWGGGARRRLAWLQSGALSG